MKGKESWQELEKRMDKIYGSHFNGTKRLRKKVAEMRKKDQDGAYGL